MPSEGGIRLLKVLNILDWKRAYALIVVYGYLWQIVIWGPLFWATTLISTFTGMQIPAPPVLPWEHLLVATSNLAVIGAVQFVRDKYKVPKNEGTP
jgi:hypothetical protein